MEKYKNKEVVMWIQMIHDTIQFKAAVDTVKNTLVTRNDVAK